MTRGKAATEPEAKFAADRYRAAAFALCDAATRLRDSAVQLRQTRVRASGKAADDIDNALSILDGMRAGALFAATTARVDKT